VNAKKGKGCFKIKATFSFFYAIALSDGIKKGPEKTQDFPVSPESYSIKSKKDRFPGPFRFLL
jgi:hypothetical protein